MSYLPNPHDLTYFLEIAKRKNLSRAAERLGVQQPTLSLALKRLEQGFGMTLVIREKRGIALTPEGERLMTKAHEALSQWQQLTSEISEVGKEISGTLRIGAHPSVARYALPKVLTELSVKYPKLQVQLQHDLSRRIQAQLIERSLDCALVMNPTPHPDLVNIPLLEDQVGIFSIKKVKNSDLLIFDPELQQTQAILKKLGSNRFSRTMECSNLEVIARLVYEGCGAGILPARVASLLKSPNLNRTPGTPEVSDRLYFCFPAMNRRVQRVAVFKVLLVKYLKN